MSKIPLKCRICKYHLEDEDFIEEFGTKDMCGYDDELNPLSDGCDEWKIGKWALLDYLTELEKRLKKIE